MPHKQHAHYLGKSIFILLILQIVNAAIWSNHFPNPTESRITSAAFGNGKVLAVGMEGTLLQSTDGVQWEMCYSPIDGDYLFIFYTDAFYIVNRNYKIARSTTGECYRVDLWQLVAYSTSVTASPQNQFAPSPVPSGWNKGFVAAAFKQLYYSFDGNISTFTKVKNSFKSYSVIGVTYGTKWVTKLTLPGTDKIFFSSSSDGQNWGGATDSTFTSSDDTDYAIAYCSSSKLYISSFNEGIGTSSDGINWSISQSTFQESLHSIECIGDQCVGVTSNDVYSTNSCGTNWAQVSLQNLRTISYSFPVVAQFVNNNIQNSAFIIGGNDAIIYTYNASNASPKWKQTGASSSQTNQFYKCYELVYSGSLFVVGCSGSVLLSSDGINWDRDPYSLSNTKDDQVSLITSNNLGLLAAEGENDMIFLSSNNGASWKYNVEFELHSDDDFDIYNIKAIEGQWVVLASDLTPITSASQFTPYYEHDDPTDLDVYNPYIILSDTYNASKWTAYGSDAWINDVTYIPSRKILIGAGKGGIFTSSNYYHWTRISEINGECTIIKYDGSASLVSLCLNNGDNIIKVSTDSGITWKNYQSPCSTSVRATKTALTCKFLEYLNSIQSFLIYTDQIVGTAYASSNAGASWKLLTFPYAMSFWSFADNKDNILVTLTDEVILSGEVKSITYASPPINSIEYTKSTTAPTRATFPVVGEVATFPDDDEKSDDDGLSAGAIVGIVFGSISGFLLFVCFGVLLLVGGVIVYSKSHKTPEDTALLAHEEL